MKTLLISYKKSAEEYFIWDELPDEVEEVSIVPFGTDPIDQTLDLLRRRKFCKFSNENFN